MGAMKPWSDEPRETFEPPSRSGAGSVEELMANSSAGRCAASSSSASAMRATGNGAAAENIVWVHIYLADPYTGFLNWAVLSYAEVPIYHAAVEVYGKEWFFNYFEDTWDDPSYSGVMSCEPKGNETFEYNHSVCLGPTPLTRQEWMKLISNMHEEWPANSYHLTRRNCLTFADCLVKELRTRDPFPELLRGFGEAEKNMPRTEALIDYGWSWAKWYMQYKHAPSEEATAQEEDQAPTAAVPAAAEA